MKESGWFYDRDKIDNNINNTEERAQTLYHNTRTRHQYMSTSSLPGREVTNEMQHYRNSGHQNLTAGITTTEGFLPYIVN